MKKGIVSAVLFLTCSLALADDWIMIAGTQGDDWIYYGLKGSYELKFNKAGEEIAVITGKTDDKQKRRIDLEKLYVRTADCKRKQGKAVALTMDGEFKYDYDFIFQAGSVGSSKAEFVCSIYFADTAVKSGKGL
jgi:hypothetical protein